MPRWWPSPMGCPFLDARLHACSQINQGYLSWKTQWYLRVGVWGVWGEAYIQMPVVAEEQQENIGLYLLLMSAQRHVGNYGPRWAKFPSISSSICNRKHFHPRNKKSVLQPWFRQPPCQISQYNYNICCFYTLNVVPNSQTKASLKL